MVRAVRPGHLTPTPPANLGDQSGAERRRTFRSPETWSRARTIYSLFESKEQAEHLRDERMDHHRFRTIRSAQRRLLSATTDARLDAGAGKIAR